jgi:hypothetical protein
VASRLPAEHPALFAVLCPAGAGNFDLTKRLVPRQQRIERRQRARRCAFVTCCDSVAAQPGGLSKPGD